MSITRKIGIFSPSNVAFNRFLPALQGSDLLLYGGIAVASKDEWFSGNGRSMPCGWLEKEADKAQQFQNKYGGNIYKGFYKMLQDPDIEAIYLPLPPAMHFMWAREAIKYGKHILLEKPSVTNAQDALELIRMAEERHVALHENYMFRYHSQLQEIMTMIRQGVVGDIRTYKISFGFPMRALSDFRYIKAMGGGALLDCGGYPICLANMLLGESSRVVYAKLNNLNGFEVDMFGSVVMENNDGITAQISFGMDNAYQCQLEVWGSKLTVIAPRIFTAGRDVSPKLLVKSSSNEETRELKKDDHFLKSINHFCLCMDDEWIRKKIIKIFSDRQIAYKK